MPFNKVIYDGDVLIDLTDDTVSPGTLLQGITAHDKSGSVIEGQIPMNESVEGVLQNGDDVYHIPAGYHDGSGTVQIDDAEKEKLIPGNVRKGVTLLGVEGTVEPDVPLPSLDTPGTAADLRSGKQLIDQDGLVVEGSMPEVPRAVPSISVDPAGLITATTEQSEGYVSSGTESETQQLSTDPGQTVTPSTESQTAVTAGKYMTGPVIVDGDEKLLPENIKSGVSIFGVEGNYAGPGLPTLVSPGSAGDLRTGKQLINQNGEIVNGSMPIISSVTPSINIDNDGLITTAVTFPRAGYVPQNKKMTNELQLSTEGTKYVMPTETTQVAVPYHTYTTGTIYVQGDDDLLPQNIKKDVSIFGVVGTYEGSGGSLPSLSTPGTASDLKYGKQLIDQNGDVITGSMSTLSLAKPTIEVTSSGAITATVTQSESGYLSADTKRGTYQLSTQATKTVTPGTSRKTVVAPSVYTTGFVYVQGDENLVGSNIKDGVSIFGVEGTYTGQSLPSLSTPGVAADLKSGKQLINQSGSIVTGSMPTVSWAKPTMRFQTDGTINVTATQDEGFIAGGDQTATAQFPSTMTSSGGTYTPTTSRQTIVPSARWTTGYHYMAGDANLVSGNIRKGISIFNVAGTYEGTATPSYTTFSNITASVSRTLDPTLTFSISPSVNAQQLVACAGMLHITGTAYSPYAGSIALSSTPCIYYYLLGSDAFLYIPTSPQDAYFALSMLNNTNTKISGSTLTLDLSHDTANSATWYLGVTSARFPGVVKVVYI